MTSHLAVLIGMALFSASALAKVDCNATDFSPTSFLIKSGNRNIFILGWEHLVDSESSILIEGFDQADEQASSGDCSGALMTAKATMLALDKETSAASAMVATLRSIDKVVGLESIGVEMTPIELADETSRLNRIDARALKLRQLCGEASLPYVAKYLLIVPGPEFRMEHESGEQIPTIATEDEKLKAENGKDFEPDGQVEFDFTNPKITFEGRSAIEKMRRLIAADAFPDADLVAAVVAFEESPSRRAKLVKDLNHSIGRALKQNRGLKLRNVAIAASLLRTSGNVAMPIGWSHVDDLKREILRQCHELAN